MGTFFTTFLKGILAFLDQRGALNFVHFKSFCSVQYAQLIELSDEKKNGKSYTEMHVLGVHKCTSLNNNEVLS